MTLPRIATVAQVAAPYQTTPSHIYELSAVGYFAPAILCRLGRKLRFDTRALERFMRAEGARLN